MNILGIETSCDETALSIVEVFSEKEKTSFRVLGSSLYSQVAVHAQYGGVFPNIAKREHAKNLIPLLKKLLEETAGSTPTQNTSLTENTRLHLQTLFEREPELYSSFIEYIPTISKPNIDTIAVTFGPGLEPALWVGINFAKALGYVWNIPVVPVNHMRGHIVSILTNEAYSVTFPALALLISGGHTELVHLESWQNTKIIGETKDDAVGEAFDKVARMLGLPYPGGPEISKYAELERHINPLPDPQFKLPRPMLHSNDYNFSFSGLKTAVLYMIKKIPTITDEVRQKVAREFEDAATEVLVEKTKRAIGQYGVHTLIIGGGVIANAYIRNAFAQLEQHTAGLKIYIPEKTLATDNAVMIAIAGAFSEKRESTENIKAQGNAHL